MDSCMKVDGKNGRTLLGWGAQDVQKAGMGGLVMDCGEGDDSFLSLRSSVIHTKGVIALGEALGRIETNEQKFARLEARVAELEGAA